ncbi:MAG: 30S ribosome-binding factor RbfA [Oscillospiraceae bacterium]|jgi:ribosome-binding factor A|nr:30S ribosome-binding factor RbfA [Oscillospiraceae bacterium]
MPSNRLQRINSDIERAVSSLLRDIKDPRVNQGMISVTAAEASGDLKYCSVYLSVMGLRDERSFLRGLKSASGYLRRGLGAALSLRATPELIFHLDRSIERGARINSIISGLNIGAEDGGNVENSDDSE